MANATVVESGTPAWGPDEAWRLADEASLSIGVEQGEEPYMFYRVGGILPLDDGRILVSDWGASELRFFGADGTFIKTVGRRGQGPGEYAEFSSMRLYGPTPAGQILVGDSGNGRVNVIDQEGEFVTQLQIQPAPDAPRGNVVGLFGDGSLLVIAVEGGGALRGEPGTIIQLTYLHLRYSAEATPIGVLARTQARPRFVNEVGGVTNYPYIPFSADGQVVPAGELLWTTDGAEPELVAYDFDGRVVRRMRWSIPDRVRTSDVYERYTTEALEQLTDEQRRAQYAHLYAQELPIPEYVPAHQDMIADANGNLWLERYRLPWENQPRWDVVDPERGWLGVVETPQGFDVQRIGPDSVAGVHRDEEGVSRAQSYPLIKQ